MENTIETKISLRFGKGDYFAGWRDPVRTIRRGVRRR